ncbi:hypothetical protein [Paraburkholderia sediminicola]|uniref:hypothetical protein n=1 Tax=Paraburkholderia sediminicola TaxID=458836 RepID=UPI0038B906ED
MPVHLQSKDISHQGFPSVDWLELDTPENMVVREKSGIRVPICLKSKLADGTLLTDRVNARVHMVIREVVYYSRYRSSDCRVDSGVVQRKMAQRLVNLASWMVERGLYDFGDLSMTHITKFLDDAAKGYESLINSPRRVFEYLKAMSEANKSLDGMTFPDVRKSVFGNRLAMPRAKSIFDEVKEHCKIRPISEYEFKQPPLDRGEAAHYSTVRAVHLLYILRDHLSSCLTFDPFPDGLPANVKTNGRPGHTPTIPEVAGLHLLQSAIHWVVEIGPKLIALYRVMTKESKFQGQPENKRRIIEDFNAKYSSKIGFRLSRDRTSEAGHIYCVDAIKRYLPNACFIVAGILSARRRIELLTLRTDAIRGSRQSGFWMECYIAKTKRKRELVPVPEVVVSAIRLMRRFGTYVRKSPNKFIFAVRTVIHGTFRDDRVGKLDQCMDDFAKITGNPYVSGSKGWQPWHYTAHQLRKLFAILYVWRYDAGDLSSLSYHLRHFSIEMTLTYVRDREMIRLLGGEMYRLAARKTQAMLDGTLHPAGIFGKKLLRMVERLRPSIRLASDADVERQLTELLRDADIAVKANPWGYCACKAVPSNLRRAACQQKDCRTGRLGVDGRPDHTGSDEVRCSGCLFFFTDETRRAHWHSAEKELQESLRKPIKLAPLLRERMQKHLNKMNTFSSNAFA